MKIKLICKYRIYPQVVKDSINPIDLEELAQGSPSLSRAI